MPVKTHESTLWAHPPHPVFFPALSFVRATVRRTSDIDRDRLVFERDRHRPQSNEESRRAITARQKHGSSYYGKRHRADGRHTSRTGSELLPLVPPPSRIINTLRVFPLLLFSSVLYIVLHSSRKPIAPFEIDIFTVFLTLFEISPETIVSVFFFQ